MNKPVELEWAAGALKSMSDPSFQNDKTLGESLYDEAIALLVRGNPVAARSLFSRVLELEAICVEPDRLLISRTHLALGDACMDQGLVDEAESYYIQSLETADGSKDDYVIQVTSALIGLTKVKLRRRQVSEARSLLETVLSERVRVLGSEHPLTAAAMKMVSSARKRQGLAGSAELTRRSEHVLGHWMEPVFGAVEDAVEGLQLDKTPLTPEQCTTLEPRIRDTIRLLEQLVGVEHGALCPHLEQHAVVLRIMGRSIEADAAENRAASIRSRL